LLQLLDDTPVVPGDVRPPYAHASQTRQILNDAEDDLREWRLDAGFVGDDKTVVMDGSEPMTQKAEETGKQKEKSKQKEAEKGNVAGTDGDGLGDKY
jgi:cbb3-type cytochrome oxidase cytochrome c subunit